MGFLNTLYKHIMAINSKQIFTLAFSAIILSIFIVLVVFVSGCVGGGSGGSTCTVDNTSNCTTAQACFNGVCTATCKETSDCKIDNTECREPSDDNEKRQTSPNVKFCLAAKRGPTTEKPTTNPNNPKMAAISDSFLTSNIYIEDPLKIKPDQDIKINIEVGNKDNVSLFKNTNNYPAKVVFNNLYGFITATSPGLEIKNDEVIKSIGESLDKNKRNISFNFQNRDSNAKIGSKYNYTYVIRTMNLENELPSYISLKKIDLIKNDFGISLTNKDGNYSISIDPSFDFAPLHLEFKADSDTVCEQNVCKKKYNLTYILKDENTKISDIKGYNLNLTGISCPSKIGGDTSAGIDSSGYEYNSLSATIPNITLPVYVWVKTLNNNEKTTFNIDLKFSIEETKILSYSSKTGIGDIYINSCNNNAQCKNNEECKDGKCILKGSSSSGSSSGGQV